MSGKSFGERMPSVRVALMASAAIAALLVALPAHAQDAETPTPPPAPAATPTPSPAPSQADAEVPAPAVPAEVGSRTYTPQDFARFAPRTALDMLRQVPGFQIREASQERGLGQATGNVLLNGQRLSGKSDDVITQLGRVPAGNVVRIEIVDASTLDISGLSGQVANITVRAGGISGQFSYTPEFRTNFTHPVLSRFSVSVSGTEGPVQYTLGLENQASHGGAGGPTLILNSDGSLRDTWLDEWSTTFNQPRASARFVIDGPGTSLGNINMVYREFWYDYLEDGLRQRPGQLPRERGVLTQEDGHNYELGGDYEFALGGGRFKLIGLQRFSHAIFSQQVTTMFADGQPDQGNLFFRDASELERIGRAEYRWKAGGADWQISGEAAFNSLDTAAQVGTLQLDGTFDTAPLAGSAARVEEARYEGIVSYGRPLSSTFNFQLAVGAEYSQISQIGANGLTREFVRPKGQLTAAWTPDPETTFNLRLQRRVGQISFFDFVDSVNLQDDKQNAGNAELVPPQSWEAELEGVFRLGAYGQTSIRTYYHQVEDIIDIIPIGATGQGVGNIDSATRLGVDWRSTFNFDPFGLRGAKLDLRVLLQRTELADPLTGDIRPISNATQRFVDFNLRYDIPDSVWAAGFLASYQKNALSYRLTDFGITTEGPVFASVYVENKDVYGLTIRLQAGNVFDARSTREQFYFSGRRNVAPLDFIELRDRLIGPIFQLQIRGKF